MIRLTVLTIGSQSPGFATLHCSTGSSQRSKGTSGTTQQNNVSQPDARNPQ